MAIRLYVASTYKVDWKSSGVHSRMAGCIRSCIESCIDEYNETSEDQLEPIYLDDDENDCSDWELSKKTAENLPQILKNMPDEHINEHFVHEDPCYYDHKAPKEFMIDLINELLETAEPDHHYIKMC